MDSGPASINGENEGEEKAASALRVQHLFESLSKNDDGAARQELYRSLIAVAQEAAGRSYSPYSDFPVGAALLTRGGKLFSGCNVENASYGGTICAERTAIVKAVSEGHRDIEMIAVVCLKSRGSFPCGACRQFIIEFGSEITIIVQGERGSLQVSKIGELLPHTFGPGALGKSDF